jgi:glycosyltransferase involved in cell wall biosynthesis
VDTTQWRPAEADERARRHDAICAEFGFPGDALLVGMAAQLIERKGHATLLDALPAVLDAHPRTRVLLFGQGPLTEAMAARVQADARLREAVRLTGFRRDLAQLLPALDLMVHPASMEGLGVALLQAAACGLPMVAGRAGGIPEIVRPGLNGELITPGDVAALAQHMTALLGSASQRSTYGAAAREWVQQHFSIDAMVAGNLAVYRSLLQAHRSGG